MDLHEYKEIIEGLSPQQRTEKYIKIHFPELWDHINNQYCVGLVNEELSWSEKMYWFENDLASHPVCKTCGRPVRFDTSITSYRKYCSPKCSDIGKERLDKIKQTTLERYGVENYAHTDECKKKMKNTCLERYGVEHYVQTNEFKEKSKQSHLNSYGVENPMRSESVKAKSKKTCLERYGVEYPTKLQKFKDKIRETNLKRYGMRSYSQTEECKKKMKELNLERYGVECYMQSKEFREKTKQTNLKRYGVEHYSQTDEYKLKMQKNMENIKHKIHTVKKKNGTFNFSKIEQEFRNWLDINNIEYKYQYRSEQYPFVCDFYFPSKDLYLEIQGSWTHGCHPYDPESQEDQDTLTLWTEKGSKYYNAAIETWTIRDPMKRKWAREHGLNWIEVFSCDLEEIILIIHSINDSKIN